MGQETCSILVKNIKIQGDLILSPMDGFSDSPFRILTRKLGSAASYSEFINALDIINGRPYMAERLRFSEIERPFFLQMLDNSVERLVQVAQRLNDELMPDAIDINLGCCARSVVSRGAGAGLLRSPRIIAELFQKLTRVLEIPMTAKIRLGWDSTSRNYIEIAKILEENGCSLIAVHGRTRAQLYQGLADWDAIAEVKQSVTIPVIGNGDVLNVSDIVEMKKHTNCDAIMIGRGAIQNPWIFSRMDRGDVPTELVHRTMVVHLQEMIKFYGHDLGLLRFRKFANGYLKIYALEKATRNSLLTCTSEGEFSNILREIFQRIG